MKIYSKTGISKTKKRINTCARKSPGDSGFLFFSSFLSCLSLLLRCAECVTLISTRTSRNWKLVENNEKIITATCFCVFIHGIHRIKLVIKTSRKVFNYYWGTIARVCRCEGHYGHQLVLKQYLCGRICLILLCFNCD